MDEHHNHTITLIYQFAMEQAKIKPETKIEDVDYIAFSSSSEDEQKPCPGSPIPSQRTISKSVCKYSTYSRSGNINSSMYITASRNAFCTPNYSVPALISQVTLEVGSVPKPFFCHILT